MVVECGCEDIAFTVDVKLSVTNGHRMRNVDDIAFLHMQENG